MSEPRDIRLKRLRIRSWRRGTKEMDLLLGGWSDTQLAGLDDDTLTRYEALLEENDHDLYLWVSGQAPAPDAHELLIRRIAADMTSQRSAIS